METYKYVHPFSFTLWLHIFRKNQLKLKSLLWKTKNSTSHSIFRRSSESSIFSGIAKRPPLGDYDIWHCDLYMLIACLISYSPG